MADVQVKIVESKTGNAAAEVSKELDQLEGKAGGIGKSLGSAFSGLSGQIPGVSSLTGALGGMATAAGAAALAGAALKGAWDLGTMALQAQRSEGYFKAFSGSANTATANLDAVMRATDGAIDRQTAMQTATQYLSMGLAKNSDDLAKLTRMAVMLGGGTREATAALGDFALMLANQSIERLDQFGISSGRVRQRIDEMMASNKNLTREQAFTNAVLEIGGTKLATLEASGIRAGTEADRLSAAWKDLRTELGVPISGTVQIVTKIVADTMQGAAEGMRDARETGGVGTSGQAALRAQQLTATRDALTMATRNLAIAEEAGEQATIAQARADVAAAQAAADHAQGLMYAARARQMYQEGVPQAVTANLNFQASLKSMGDEALSTAQKLAILRGVEGGLVGGLGAGDWANWNPFPTEDQKRRDRRGVEGGLLGGVGYEGWVAAPLVGGGPVVGSAAWLAQQADINRGNDLQDLIDKMKQGEKDTTEQAKRDWQTAVNEMADTFSSAMQEAVGFSKGLNPPGSNTNPLAPGAGGPFEGVYRAQAWAMRPGDKSSAQWQQMYGLGTPEQTLGIVQAFQTGNWGPALGAGLIDEKALVAYAKQQQGGKDWQAQYAQMLAEKYGLGGGGLGAIGLADGKTGGSTEKGATGDFLTGLGDKTLAAMDKELLTDDKKKQFQAKGASVWDEFGKGIVDRAKSTVIWQAAIDASVDASLKRYTGGK